MSGRSRASSCPSQAKLMRDRGDLHGKRAAFNVRLPKPSPLALQAENPFDRLGMDVRRDEVPKRLLVAEIDRNPRKKTPVARWNTGEDRRANRGEQERHASFPLLPGDRLSAVNDVNGETAMLSELMESVDYTNPKEMSLAVSRNISDVMTPPQKESSLDGAPADARPPRPHTPSSSRTSTPSLQQEETDSTVMHSMPPRTPPRHARSSPSSRCASAPRLRQETDSMVMHSTPPRTANRHTHSSPSSRCTSALRLRQETDFMVMHSIPPHTPKVTKHTYGSPSSAGSTSSSRSRSGSSHGIMRRSCGSALGIGVSLSCAGDVALAF